MRQLANGPRSPIGRQLDEVVYLAAREEGKSITATLLAPALELASSKHVPGLYLLTSKDVWLPVDFHISPIVTEGSVTGAVLALRDVTEQHAVDRAKTEFVSLASHQLRTPLSTIRWNSEMLLETRGRLEPEMVPMVEAIHDSNLAMIDLINDLLNVSKIELGKLSIDDEPADLTAVLREVSASLQPQYNTARQHLELLVQPHAPLLRLGRKWQTIIVENLLTNAHKYTPDDGTISVSLRHGAGAPTRVAGKQVKDGSMVLCVRDTGYGIPEEVQERIFQKLFRAENIASLDVTGTGLGLYLCHEVIHQSGGIITFTSREGEGTAFYVVYPPSRLAATVPSAH